MNALTLAALGLAQRAASAMPVLFVDLGKRHLAPHLSRIATSGYSSNGTGPGEYVADALATPELLAAHKRFVIRSANGRIYRLLPPNGAISVEQGGAVGDGASNDQPAVQAAIAYAEAIGAREVYFESEHYLLACPERTSPADATRALDGHPLVITCSLILRGAAAARTVLDFRGIAGADPEANWQIVAASTNDQRDAVWRGGGIFLDGEVAAPGDGARRIERVKLHRLVLKGNRQRTGKYAFPADPADGDGWDITDKAIWLQDCHAGDIAMTDVDCLGWKGEIVYFGGGADAARSITLERCRFLTSNGSAFNPGVKAKVRARDCEFGDCFQAQEDTAKTDALYRNCLWRDCDHMGLGGGPTGAFEHNLAYPTRDAGTPLPMTRLEDCTFRSINLVYIASWVSGRVTTIDTQVTLDANQSMAVRDVDLAVEAWLDREDSLFSCSLFGPTSQTEPVPGAPEGTFKEPLQNVRIRLRHYRTALAEALGHQWRGPIWSGFIRPTCRLSAEGEFASQTTPNGGGYPMSFPFVAFDSAGATTSYTAHGYYIAPAFNGGGELNPAGPVMAVQVASETMLDMYLARWPGGGPGFGYAEGQCVRLVKNDDQGAIRFAKGANPAACALNATRVLDNAHDWIEFTFNASVRRWEESGFFSSAG